MSAEWTDGNAISLLENGDELFPRILAVIDQVRYELIIETFILEDDPVGRKVQKALIAAAKRGVWISVLVDGYGSHFLPRTFIEELQQIGIHFHTYHPQPRWLKVRANVFRRMHRKLLVADGQTAFVGGINLAHNHTSDYGRDFKQDYAVELQGPVVGSIRAFLRDTVRECFGGPIKLAELPETMLRPETAGNARIRFVTRDNESLPTAIEREYLRRIRTAEHHITITNPYFFPGYRLLKGLRKAARRGVKVRLLIQGKPGSPLAKRAAAILYEFLVESGVEVYEYWERQLHGKTAAIDDEWSTVGSSNLDPLSLSLNLEANVFVLDRDFNRQLQEHMHALMKRTRARPVNESWLRRRTLVKWFGTFLVYHFLRYFPGLTGWLPPLERVKPPAPPVEASRPGKDPDSGS